MFSKINDVIFHLRLRDDFRIVSRTDFPVMSEVLLKRRKGPSLFNDDGQVEGFSRG